MASEAVVMQYLTTVRFPYDPITHILQRGIDLGKSQHDCDRSAAGISVRVQNGMVTKMAVQRHARLMELSTRCLADDTNLEAVGRCWEGEAGRPGGHQSSSNGIRSNPENIPGWLNVIVLRRNMSQGRGTFVGGGLGRGY